VESPGLVGRRLRIEEPSSGAKCVPVEVTQNRKIAALKPSATLAADARAKDAPTPYATIHHALLEAEQDLEVCAEAENGKEAVQLCDALRPDVVSLDLSMPVMGGLEATRMIVGIAPATAIIIVSVHDSPAMFDAAIEAGARGYVLKNEASTHLVRAVRTLLAPNATYFPLRSQMR
jgi:DNA-binding NarL/FixJ family response regulator